MVSSCRPAWKTTARMKPTTILRIPGWTALMIARFCSSRDHFPDVRRREARPILLIAGSQRDNCKDRSRCHSSCTILADTILVQYKFRLCNSSELPACETVLDIIGDLLHTDASSSISLLMTGSSVCSASCRYYRTDYPFIFGLGRT
jgi:hypothetical protein